MKNTLFYRFLVVFFVSLHQLTNGLIRNVKTLNWKIERILRKFHTSGWSQSQSQQVFCRFSVCLFFCKSIFLSLSALSSVFIHRGSTLASACLPILDEEIRLNMILALFKSVNFGGVTQCERGFDYML